jgi:hypothetical protein
VQVERDEGAEEVYKLHRSCIEHEDNLVNQRTTWLITVQSFLIATFGLSYQKKFEVAEKLAFTGKDLTALGSIYDEYRVFMLVLACVGLITAIAAFFSVYAAVRALRSIRDSWLKSFPTQPHPYLPGITGGGDPKAERRGISLSMWAPVFFSLLWSAVILFLLVSVTLKAGPR